jgi:hypothetical protein
VHVYRNDTKEESVANRLRNLAVGAAVLIAGVVGLFLPVSVFDGNSSTVGCGNALVADHSGPSAANDTTVANVPIPTQGIAHPGYVPDLVAACESAISGRRHWAIPLVIVGTAGILLGLLVRGRRGGISK